MAEEKIHFRSGDLQLEGRLENRPGEKAVVITHPHPNYGGDMYNNVVEAIIQAYRNDGYSTLRFNFRGAGQSEGEFGDGIGEQEDISAAIGYLSDLGKRHIDLAGYSFGSWVIALGLEKYDRVSRVVMVSPPVNFIDFSFLACNQKIRLVIAGTEDDIAGSEKIAEMIKTWNPDATLRVIRGADHFYWGKTDEIRSIIQEFLSEKQ